MRVAYLEHREVGGIVDHLREAAPRTVVFDVEPLIAYWDTHTATLDQGIAQCLEMLTAVRGLEAIVFSTNSHRRPSVLPQRTAVSVDYRSAAMKPFRTSHYRTLPQPGVLIGDQVATDGLLAWRLGFSFIRYRPLHHPIPLGPRLMNALGYPLRPLLFLR